MKRGFTVVEVIVTMVIIVIILGLGVVGLRSSLANARDSERESDIETIARGLEQRYNRAYSYSYKHDSDNNGVEEDYTINIEAGSYPGNNEMWDFLYYNRIKPAQIFTGVQQQSLRSPSDNGMDSVCFFYSYNMPKCDAVEKDANIQEVFASDDDTWKDKYVYEFIGADNKYCNGNECVRYNLYWISETDKTVYKGIPGLKVRKSKHQ